MKMFLWLFGFALCLLPALFTLLAYPFSLYKRYGGIVETELSFTEAHTIGFLSTATLSLLYLYATRHIFNTFKTLLKTVQPKQLAKPATLLFIVLLTGLMHTLLYSSFIVNFAVAFTYFLGFYGMWSIYESVRYKDERRRWLVLVFGVISVLIAYASLEVLLRDMGRR